MKTSKYLVALALVSVLISCSTSSELGVKIDNLLQSKRYKETLKDRNALYAENLDLKKDTVKLGTQIRSLKTQIKGLNNDIAGLKKDYSDLTAKYNDYLDQSDKKLTALNEQLKSKTDELNLKGKQLNDRMQQLVEMEAIISKQDSAARKLSNLVKNAITGFNEEELFVEEKNGEVYLSMADKFLFKSGSTTVEEKGKGMLEKLSGVLKQDIDSDISIEGLYLSMPRVLSIVKILHENDIDPTRLTVSGKGLSAVQNENSESRTKNGKTTIILTPKINELNNLMEKK